MILGRRVERRDSFFAKSEMNLELSPLLPNYPKERIDAILGVITQFEQEQVPGLGMDFNVFDWKEHGLESYLIYFQSKLVYS